MSLDSVCVISEKSERELTQKQLLDYRTNKQDLLSWFLEKGKNPSRGEGYSESTVGVMTYQIDKFYRWIWKQEGYTTNFTPAHADAYMGEIARSDHSNGYKGTVKKILKRLFKVQTGCFEPCRGGWAMNAQLENGNGLRYMRSVKGDHGTPSKFFVRDGDYWPSALRKFHFD